MTDWLKWGGSFLALVGALWGGFLAVDTRYASAREMRQQVDGLKALYLQQQVSGLEREEFELEREKSRRTLSTLEARRLNEIKRQLDHLRPQLRMVEP